MGDAFNLQRFLDAQAEVYSTVVAELAAGRKRSHWVWFIFPQIAGLGSSDMARRFAIGSMAEAVAYLAHPVLRARLEECASLVNAAGGRELSQVLGYPDDMKFHSSMTLFAQATGEGASVFAEALTLWFDGAPDMATLDLIG